MATQKMNCRLVDASGFKTVVNSMKDLVKAVHLNCKSNELLVECCDTSNVVLMQLRLREAHFDFYDCPTEFKIGMNMESLNRVLGMCGPNDKLNFEAILSQAGPGEEEEDGAEKAGSKLIFIFENDEDTDRQSSFEMRAITVPHDAIVLQDTVYDATVIFPCVALKNAVEALREFGEALEVKVSKDTLKLSVSGENGTGTINFNHSPPRKDDDNEGTTIQMNVDKPVYITYPMRYMAFFVKATTLCKMCNFSFKNGAPFCLQYTLSGDELDGWLRFMLAPKVTES